jgi:membrane-bound lytic murein transglycosylase D
MSVAQIAKAIGVPAAELEILNAELRHKVTPPGPYALRLPPGKTGRFAEKQAGIATWLPPRKMYSSHTIKQGETLSHLARRYHTTATRIAKLNKMSLKATLHVGQRLKVPFNEKAARSAVSKPKRLKSKAKKIRYHVKKGDSVWLLARRYNTTVEAIMQGNGLDSPSLRVGQLLEIPTGTKRVPAATNLKKVRIRPGDTPFQIARDHNMKLEELLRINKLTPRSRIFPGQELLVTSD